MTKATDTNKATEAAKATDANKAADVDKATVADKRRERTDAVPDDELESVSGGDLYMQHPRGSLRRINE